MKSYVLMILLLFGSLCTHAQTEGETLVSLHKEKWEGVEEVPLWSYFVDPETDATLEAVDEGLAITNPHVQAQAWQPTVTVVDNCLMLEEGHDYIVRLTVKVPSDGTYQLRLGNWDYYDMRQIHVKASNDFQVIDVEYPEYKGKAVGNGHVLLQLGWVEGTTIIKEVEVFEIVSDSTTTIKASKAAKASKADDTIYNLAGLRVDTAYGGIVIRNGKKHVK